MSANTQLTPEILVPRIGDYLVEKGLITQDDLQRALDHQTSQQTPDIKPPVGQVLVDLGIIDRETLDRAITEQALQLRAALLEANRQLLDANEQLERRVQERTAELQQALQKLSELNQLKSNIVANISHELRTPLTHLKGYLELMLSGEFGSVNSDQLNALNVMQRASDRLGRLIEDLILFSVSEKDQIFLQIRPINMVDLCQRSILRSRSKADEKKISLTLQAQPNMPLALADEEKISWVVMQLLDNALKFTSNGGKVSLEVMSDADFVEISVADNGIGIPAERMKELFEPFHQLDGSSTRKYGGTGLGLALVKKIIEAHGSVIHVTSEKGKGTRFTFPLKIG